MTFGDWLKTGKVYAARGYTSLVGWLITIGTFAMVLYDNLILLFPFLVVVFPNAIVFMLITMPFVLIILAVMGRWDWKVGTFPTEGATAFKNNPEWVALRKDVDKISEKLDYDANTLNDILDLLIKKD
jgi:hypothetical protein